MYRYNIQVHTHYICVRLLLLINIQGADFNRDTCPHTQDLKWQRMDSKYSDASKKIVQAIDSFRAAHEALKVLSLGFRV